MAYQSDENNGYDQEQLPTIEEADDHYNAELDVFRIPYSNESSFERAFTDRNEHDLAALENTKPLTPPELAETYDDQLHDLFIWLCCLFVTQAAKSYRCLNLLKLLMHVVPRLAKTICNQELVVTLVQVS